MDERLSPDVDHDRGYAPGGGYSDSAAFPADDYRWRSTPVHGYGSQDEFDRAPEDAFRRSGKGGGRERAGEQRASRARSWAPTAPRTKAEGDAEDVGYGRRALPRPLTRAARDVRPARSVRAGTPSDVSNLAAKKPSM